MQIRKKGKFDCRNLKSLEIELSFASFSPAQENTECAMAQYQFATDYNIVSHIIYMIVLIIRYGIIYIPLSI